MKKIATFGELLLRLSPIADFRIGQMPMLNSCYGGSEANVAVALALYGIPVSFISRLPDNDLGQNAKNLLKSYGVDVTWVQMVSHGRMGLYFLQPGYKECSCSCTYDRSASSMSLSRSIDFDWGKILQNVDMFHFSGITPALTSPLSQICREACIMATKRNLIISCDLNYRSKLWSKDAASAVMNDLCRHADILFINEDEASLLGFEASGESLMELDVFAAMVEHITHIYPAKVITTVARVPFDAFHLGIKAMLWSDHNYFQSEIFPLCRVVDANGAGDAYAAAFLYGLNIGMDKSYLVNFAAAACNLKHSCYGDINLTPLSDIKNFAKQKYANGACR